MVYFSQSHMERFKQHLKITVGSFGHIFRTHGYEIYCSPESWHGPDISFIGDVMYSCFTHLIWTSKISNTKPVCCWVCNGRNVIYPGKILWRWISICERFSNDVMRMRLLLWDCLVGMGMHIQLEQLVTGFQSTPDTPIFSCALQTTAKLVFRFF